MNKLLHPHCILLMISILVSAGAYSRRPEASERVLWTDPGDPSLLDFEHGIGGTGHQPQPPFRFIGEDLSGTSPKVDVIDGTGAMWNVKWGHEVKASTFCTRLVWACGYYAEPEYFVSSGRIEAAHALKRARSHISPDGSFVNARFQLRSGVPKFMTGQSWAWSSNPFLSTHELSGLKLLMLLVSNWDAKDSRDLKGDSSTNTNLAVFEDNSLGMRRYLYADDDWGASLGKWGNTFTWTKWDCSGFADQTADFLKVDGNGRLHWGFVGKHRQDLTRDITISDIQWLLQYLGRITDNQLRSSLEGSGATPKETECYARTIRQRIGKLQEAAAR